ncbi:MAG: hypothetical protein CL460_03840 [Acidimicrobiaceae bacterium]|nr:hypothetical protein [Acidimicrobiaceae bacterium]
MTTQVSGQFEAVAIEATLNNLRINPPTDLMGSPIVAVTDWSTLPDPFSANLLEFRSDAGVRMAIRPSGTEPKVKIYLEQVIANPRGNLRNLRADSHKHLDSLGRTTLAWFEIDT